MQKKPFNLILVLLLLAVPLGLFFYKRAMRASNTAPLADQPKATPASTPADQSTPVPITTDEAENPLPQAPAVTPTTTETNEDQEKLAKALEFMKHSPQKSSPPTAAADISSEQAARKALRGIQKCLQMNLPANGFPPQMKAQIESAQTAAKARCKEQAETLIRKFPNLKKEFD